MNENNKKKYETINVNCIDLIKYCKLHVNSRGLEPGDIFYVKDPILYTLDEHEHIYVKGDVEVAYIGGEHKWAMTRKYIEYLMNETKR